MSISYFARANSCTGLVNFFASNLSGIRKLYLLCGGTDYLRTIFLGRISGYFSEHGEAVEYVFSPMCLNKYDGIIIRSKSIAIVCADCIDEEDRKKAECDNINLDNCIGGSGGSDLNKFAADISELREHIYEQYRFAKEIHDEWEKIYIGSTDYKRLDSYCDSLLHRILPDSAGSGSSVTYERFFGAAFADSHVNFIDKLTEDISKRYFIKGRPGTGKSTFLKNISKRAAELGYDVERYYCSFDTNSMDMFVVRELSVCIFDSTAPHEKFPERPDDEILDFYVNSGLEGTDERMSKELGDICERYGERMDSARKYAVQIQKLNDNIDEISLSNLDFDKLNNLVYDILHEFY